MPGRILQGKVVSNKNDKTVTVLVNRTIFHKLYKKIITKRAKINNLFILLLVYFVSISSQSPSWL